MEKMQESINKDLEELRRRKWQLQYSCLENPVDRGAWWAAIYGVAQSRTRLKRLSTARFLLFGWSRISMSKQRFVCRSATGDEINQG